MADCSLLFLFVLVCRQCPRLNARKAAKEPFEILDDPRVECDQCGKKLGDKHSLKRHVSSKGLCVLILRMILILSFVSHICWGGLTHLFTFEFIQFSIKKTTGTYIVAKSVLLKFCNCFSKFITIHKCLDINSI